MVLSFGVAPAELAYDEFVAWAAYFHHASLHEDDAAKQAEHDRVMAGLARGSRG